MDSSKLTSFFYIIFNVGYVPLKLIYMLMTAKSSD